MLVYSEYFSNHTSCGSKSKTLYVLIIKDSPKFYIFILYTLTYKMDCKILQQCKNIFFLVLIKQKGQNIIYKFNISKRLIRAK